MIQIHPDLAQLIETVPPTSSEQRHAPFDPELYHLKIAEIFATTDPDTWGSEGRLRMKWRKQSYKISHH